MEDSGTPQNQPNPASSLPPQQQAPLADALQQQAQPATEAQTPQPASPAAEQSQAPQAPPVQQPAPQPQAVDANAALYEQLAKSVIEAQEAIIGPLALQRAQQVEGISVDTNSKDVHISGNPVEAVDRLVRQYSVLFGQISVEVCRDAAARYVVQLGTDKLPASLQS